MSFTRKLIATSQLGALACLVIVAFFVLLTGVLAVKTWRWMRS